MSKHRTICAPSDAGDVRKWSRWPTGGEGTLQLQAEQRGRAVIQQGRADPCDPAGGGRMVGGHAQRQDWLVPQQLCPRGQTMW